MAFTGKLGTFETQPGNTILGGDGPNTSGEIFADALSSIVLDQSAQSTVKLVSASSSLSLSQTAALAGTPIHKSASSSLTFTQTVTASILNINATSTLLLNDAARIASTLVKAANSTLAVTDAAIGVSNHVYVVSALELIDEADTNVKLRQLSSAITLTDTATNDIARLVFSTLELTQEATQGILTIQAGSELELSDEARNSSIKTVASPSTLALTDTATSSIKMLDATSSLTIVNTAGLTNRPIRVAAESELTVIESVFDIDVGDFVDVVTGLTDLATAYRDTVRLASNIISFAQVATQYVLYADAIEGLAESELTLTQQGRISEQLASESSLALTQEASGVVGTELVSELSTLNVTASVTVVYANITAANTLEVKQAVAFILEKGCVLQTYSPFVGSSSDPDAPTPPASTYPEPGVTAGFRLQYPAEGAVTDELLLRSPNLGNIDRLSMTRINRETRGGTLIVFADPIWPKVESLLLSFSGLTSTESQDLLAFMESHLGQEIRLIDWEDRLWRGVIVNPQDPVVQDGRGCRYTASFEFEGEKVTA